MAAIDLRSQLRFQLQFQPQASSGFSSGFGPGFSTAPLTHRHGNPDVLPAAAPLYRPQRRRSMPAVTISVILDGTLVGREKQRWRKLRFNSNTANCLCSLWSGQDDSRSWVFNTNCTTVEIRSLFHSIRTESVPQGDQGNVAVFPETALKLPEQSRRPLSRVSALGTLMPASLSGLEQVQLLVECEGYFEQGVTMPLLAA